MHRKLLNDSGAQTTSDFLLSYQLLLQLNGSSGNDYAVLLSNPATTLNNMIAANFKLAMERAVARLMPRRSLLGEPGAKVLPPVVKQVKFGSPVVMNMTMRLNVVAAMKAASQHTGLPPAELMAAVDAAMTGGHALKMELDDSRMGPAAAAPVPVMGMPYSGSYSSAVHSAPSPPAVASPFAACQPGTGYAEAAAVGSALGVGYGVQYGSHVAADGSAGYPAMIGPYSVASGNKPY
ncbi:hypothetical protein OEZ86_008191 [Tetradesmus obliquus]|nr:hypothetical protein OEZ86_008191 [Tetradesmus obliquus]